MSNENEHWCCDCYHYNGDTSIGEICDLTGENTYDSRPRNSRSCDKWEECICGPLNWEDMELLHRLFAEEEDNFSKHDKYFYTEVLTRFKQFKEGKK